LGGGGDIPDGYTAPIGTRNHLTPTLPWRASFLIGVCCLLIYNANWRSISAGDTYPARYLPFAMWKHQTVFLDPVAKITAQGRGRHAFWMVPVAGGSTISLYPVTLPVLIAPLYLPAAAYLQWRGWADERMDRMARVMEKLSASLIASLSAALLYLLLRRRAAASVALVLTFAYAFGTTTWVISSQALWQHGMAQLLVIGTLLLLTARATTARVIAAGLLCGLIAANRPPDTIIGAALGVYALFFWAGRRRAPLLIAAAALPMLLVLAYNLGVAGHIAGGYGLTGRTKFFDFDVLSGVAGLLFSPTRGLFVFSPFLLFLALAWRHLPRGREERLLTLTMAVAVILQILLYAKTDWRAGVSWGPRFLTDLLPFLVWMLVPVVASLRRFGRVCFLIAVGVAVAIEVIGAFWYTGATDDRIFGVEGAPRTMRAAWEWENAPFVASLTEGRAPAELTTRIRGSFDAIEPDERGTFTITAGQEAFAAGWALAGRATPWQIEVVVNGQVLATRHFYERSDVRTSLHEASPAGWRIPLSSANLAPGEHELAVLVLGSKNGDRYYLGERKVTVVPPSTGEDLDESARIAAARIRNHQQSEGYWLTAHTTGTSYREPRPEMNTFLTALLIELLEPLRAGGLGENVRRARRHLTAQIEPGGLVRYHGLPYGPGIGTIRCAITPDTDDTALTWRLAPGPDRTRLTTALATIEQYRTREGLYRTWLSAPENYQCLNPGSDPNPPDLTIQMHLLLLLSEVKPAAGRALCDAIRPVLDEDRVWVYYQKAPLVPMLRLPELHEAGCDLQLPESRMRTDVGDQRIWVSVARLLIGEKIAGGSPPDATLMREVLRELAREDFTVIRMRPPLLYHNDLTATVSRYYWSEDVGYALWLRLYDRYQQHLPSDLGR
jgi:hypothetical protein